MSKKNRPTLIQQFVDFILRNAPFDANPLIQKTELEQVETDFFDSVLLKEEDTVLINSPAAAFNLDFNSIDSYSVNSSGSVSVAFTITIQNLSHGQTARINITKKVNDTFSFSNASLSPIGNLSQTGTSLLFYAVSVKGTMFVLSDKKINKSDSISDNNTNQLATSKAVRDVNQILQVTTATANNSVQRSSGTPQLLIKTIPIGDWNMDSTDFILINHGIAPQKFRGIIDVTLRDDSDSTHRTLFQYGNDKVSSYSLLNNSIFLQRIIGGEFDSPNYNATSYNRGYITFMYEA